MLAGLFLLLAVYLIASENPWNDAKEMADRVAAGKSVKLEYQVALGLFLAAGLNLVICTGLLVAQASTASDALSTVTTKRSARPRKAR